MYIKICRISSHFWTFSEHSRYEFVNKTLGFTAEDVKVSSRRFPSGEKKIYISDSHPLSTQYTWVVWQGPIKEWHLFTGEEWKKWWEKGLHVSIIKLLLLLSHFSGVQLCVTPRMAAHQAPPSLGFSRQEHWSGLPFPSPMHDSEKWKGSRSVVSDSSRPHGLQPTRLPCPWGAPNCF